MAKAKVKTKEQLQDEIKALTAEREDLGEKQEALGKKLVTNYNKLELAQKLLAEMEHANVPAKELNWAALMQVQVASGNYEMLQKKVHELWVSTGNPLRYHHQPLSISCYRVDTNQHCIQLFLYKEHCNDEYLKRIKECIETVLPHIISKDGYKHLGICDPGLSMNSSYHIRYTDDGKWQMYDGRGYRNNIKYETDNLETFLKYLAGNHSHHDGSEDEDEY